MQYILNGVAQKNTNSYLKYYLLLKHVLFLSHSVAQGELAGSTVEIYF